MKRLIPKTLILSLLASSALAETTLVTNITGLPEPALANAKERINELRRSMDKTDLNSADIQALYRDAPQNIQKAIEPFGYFKSRVTPLGLTLQKNQWIANFYVNPGPALLINHVEVALEGEGKNDPELNKLLADFPLKSGQIMQTDNYDKAKSLLIQTANDQGYLKASFIQREIRINLKTYTAVVILQLNTGPRYYFGPIHFSSVPFSEDFLTRFESFHEGEPFSSQKLLKFQQDLSNSRYFTQVVVTPDTHHVSNLRVPVNVNLDVPKSQQYNFGVGYGTFTGARVSFSTDWRRVGNSGQHFTTQIKYSSVLKGLAARYFIPGKNPLTDQYTIGADAQKFLPKNGESFSEHLSAGYVKTVHEWQNNLMANYLIDRYQVVNNPSQISRLFYPSYSLTRIKADNMIYPRSGTSFSFTIQGASEHVLSETSFLQSEVKGKYIFSPTEYSRVILRGDLGYTVVNDLTRLPLTLRFFAGGLGSVRGYPYSGLGPGRYLEVASVEVQHKIIGDFYGAVFYDAGTATDHFNDALQRGEGVGLIYHSIIGPITLYAGRAMSISGKPTRIEFSIGPEL